MTGAPVVLGAAALGLLMPMHLVLDAGGLIRGAGPTLAKLLPGGGLPGQPFFDLFDVRRPGRITGMADLAARTGERLTLVLRGGGGQGFRGVALPLEGGGGLILNLSFGIGVIEAVRAHGLTDADFAATDLALELLYLVEAKSAVTAELRELNLRLQGAKLAAEAQALSDPLTGLRNRRGLDAALRAVVSAWQPFALMHLDLDHFKAVNDTHGHAAGDHVLRRVARILSEETRGGDTVARTGGDEFVLLLPGLTDRTALARLSGRLVLRLAEPMAWSDTTCAVSASIGIALGPAETTAALHDAADRALYASKHAGRNCAHLWSAAEGKALRLAP